jgi:hypothetical protein
MTSFTLGHTSYGTEMLEIPGEICDRCYSSTMKEIDAHKRKSKPDNQKIAKNGKDAMVGVFILSIILGFLATSFLLMLVVFTVGIGGVAYYTFNEIQKQDKQYKQLMNQPENPIYNHLRIYQKKCPKASHRLMDIVVFVFRSTSFMYAFNLANQSLLAQRQIFSLLHDNPSDISFSEIDMLIRRQLKPQQKTRQPRVKCPFCEKSFRYAEPSGGEYDLVKCKNCGKRFVPQ